MLNVKLPNGNLTLTSRAQDSIKNKHSKLKIKNSTLNTQHSTLNIKKKRDGKQ